MIYKKRRDLHGYAEKILPTYLALKMSLGRICPEAYRFDPDESDPRNSKWKACHPVVLLVGRGFSIEKSDLVVPLDRFGSVFKNCSSSHLWMDFNSEFALSCLPESFCKEIIVDYSTWRYLEPCRMISHYCKLLQPFGRLCFEGGISSFKVISKDIDQYQVLIYDKDAGSSWHFECENPSHLVLTRDKLENLIGRPVKISGIPKDKGIAMNKRLVVNASTMADRSQPYSDYVQDIGAILREKTLENLLQVYSVLFKEVFRVEIRTDDFPVHTTKTIPFWIQLSKIECIQDL